MLLQIALRNLRLHWVRSLIVGTLLCVGTWLVVVGQATLDAIHAGVRKSVVETLSGHLQLHSAKAKDPLELYQNSAFAEPDLGRIEDFSQVKKALETVPEVETVIPMGIGRSVVWGASILETNLAQLRRGVTALKEGQKPSDSEELKALIAHIRKLTSALTEELEKFARVTADTSELDLQRADVARANSEDFWQTFELQPLEGLEFLENRISPLSVQTGYYFFNYVGTDLAAFAKHYPLFRISEGTPVPEGERGFLFNSFYYEKFVKHRTARRLDMIKEQRELAKRNLDTDVELRRWADRNVTQITAITDQLDDLKAEALADELKAALKSEHSDLDVLLRHLLTVNEANFDQSYDIFYKVVAPKIRLYAYMVGDTIALYGQTRSGYPRAVNVKVHGVFHYDGLDKSGLAGIYNLMDMVTFRDLNGMADPIEASELADIRARSGMVVVDREDAEEALFGEGAELVAEVESTQFDEFAGHNLAGLRRAAEAEQVKPFTQDELEAGPSVSAAVFLREGYRSDEAIVQAKQHIQTVLDKANLPVNVITWEEARGTLVASLSTGITVFFYVLVSIIFVVALIVIVNSLLMSTMERVREIGTIRAIGAQRGFVVRMFAVEAGVMGLLFGLAGMALGALTVWAVGQKGVPATSEVLFFVYGGRELKPILEWSHLGIAFGIIIVIAILSSLIPAVVASRIPPIAAMQAKE